MELSEEEEKAIAETKIEIDNLRITILSFEKDVDDKDWLKKLINELNNEIRTKETVLNLIEKQSKVIDEMAEKIKDMMKISHIQPDSNFKYTGMNKEEIKQYFYGKVEENYENND